MVSPAPVAESTYPIHAVAYLLPDMPEDDYRRFVCDIREHGLREPIVLYRGAIIDGRHRYRACREAGREPRFCEWDERGSLVEYVLSLNVERRHLTPSQQAMVAADALPFFEEEAKARQATSGPGIYGGEPLVASLPQAVRGKARDEAAAKTGASPRNVQHAKRLKAKAPAVAAAVKAGTLTIHDAQALEDLPAAQQDEALDLVRSGKAKTAKAARKAVQHQARLTIVLSVLPPLPERVHLLHGDIALAGEQVESGSVDWVITDPPYDEESVPLYEEVAILAARVLKPGGSLLVMAGQSYLPDVLGLMVPHLRYHWTLSYLTPGGQAVQLWARRVNTFWKPVFWFVKGDYAGDWIGDVTKSATNDNDKQHHIWGQSESGMADLMTRFVRPGAVVLDPFLGGGTTAVIALHLGCAHFIGIDRDAQAIATTTHRLAGFEESHHDSVRTDGLA